MFNGPKFPIKYSRYGIIFNFENEIQKLVYTNSIATSKILRAFNFSLELIPLV